MKPSEGAVRAVRERLEIDGDVRAALEEAYAVDFPGYCVWCGTAGVDVEHINACEIRRGREEIERLRQVLRDHQMEVWAG